MTFLRAATLAVMLAAQVPSPRASVVDGLQWLCWLGTQPDNVLRCRLEDDPVLDLDFGAPSQASSNVAAPTEPFDNVQMRQALFAPGATPNVARLVREQPAHYAGVIWTIPLYGPPIDDHRVRELAQSVLCGASQRCETHFGNALSARHAAAR